MYACVIPHPLWTAGLVGLVTRAMRLYVCTHVEGELPRGLLLLLLRLLLLLLLMLALRRLVHGCATAASRRRGLHRGVVSIAVAPQ